MEDSKKGNYSEEECNRIVDTLKSLLATLQVESSLLVEFELEEALSDTLTSDSVDGYTFTYRLTHHQLFEQFAIKMKELQEQYKSSVKKEIQNLKLNVKTCLKMDNIIGCEGSETISEDVHTIEVKKMKDGTRKLQCPFSSCSTSTFKLRRHIKDKHGDLSPDALNYAVQMALKMERNRECDIIPNDAVKIEPRIMKKPSNVAMVSRKGNLKQCILCKGLFINLSDHVKKIHDIKTSDPSYDRYVRDPPVVPKCYTKKVNGKSIILEGNEMEKAKEDFGEKIVNQGNTLEVLKKSRNELSDVREQMINAESEEIHEELKAKLKSAQEKYFTARYPDERFYSANVEKWKTSYLAHLTVEEASNPKRIQRMAMDVFLEYENENSLELSFGDLSNPKTISAILLLFRSKKGQSITFKIKYIYQFQSFIEFLLLSVNSPENSQDLSNEELSSKNFLFKQVESEIKGEIRILNKIKGKNIICTKTKARNKLLSETELSDLFNETKRHLQSVHEDIINGVHKNYTRKQIAQVRNALIAVATVRLGRLSLEMTKMTLEEVNVATESLINGVKHYTINVSDQKNSCTGNPAPVVYEEMEFKVLSAFVKDLRPVITNNKFCRIVFSAFKKINSKCDQELGLSAAFKILKTFKTTTGKMPSSRSIRGSKVTISRDKNLSEETLNHMAKIMSHSRKTADSYYDFASIQNSVSHVLSNTSGTEPQVSTPLNYELSSADFSITGSPIPGPSGCSKRTLFSSSDSSEEDIDETIMNLRNKKIKTTDVEEAKTEIRMLVSKLIKEGLKDEIQMKSGKISVRPVTRLLPQNMKHLSVKFVREIIKGCLK